MAAQHVRTWHCMYMALYVHDIVCTCIVHGIACTCIVHGIACTCIVHGTSYRVEFSTDQTVSGSKTVKFSDEGFHIGDTGKAGV